MTHQIKYLTNVDNYLDSVSVQEQRKIVRQLKYIQEYGLNQEVLNLKKLQGYDYWEIRILGKHNTRIFCYQLKNIVYILHIFHKYTQKTKLKDLHIGQRSLETLLSKYI